MTPASPWGAVAVGFLAAHVFWSLVMLIWWHWSFRQMAKEDQRKRSWMVREHRHQWN